MVPCIFMSSVTIGIRKAIWKNSDIRIGCSHISEDMFGLRNHMGSNRVHSLAISAPLFPNVFNTSIYNNWIFDVFMHFVENGLHQEDTHFGLSSTDLLVTLMDTGAHSTLGDSSFCMHWLLKRVCELLSSRPCLQDSQERRHAGRVPRSYSWFKTQWFL